MYFACVVIDPECFGFKCAADFIYGSHEGYLLYLISGILYKPSSETKSLWRITLVRPKVLGTMRGAVRSPGLFDCYFKPYSNILTGPNQSSRQFLPCTSLLSFQDRRVSRTLQSVSTARDRSRLPA